MQTFSYPDIATRSYGRRRRGPYRRHWPPLGWTPEPDHPPERDRSMPTMQCYEITRGTDGAVDQWGFRCHECEQEHRHVPMPGMRESHCADPRSRLYGCTYRVELAGDGQ